MQTIRELFHAIEYSLPNIRFMDIVDILVVAFAIYKLIGAIRGTSASRVVKGIVVLLIVTAITSFLQLNTVNFILSKVLELGFVALVIVFQPELRRALERVGSRRIGGLFSFRAEQ